MEFQKSKKFKKVQVMEFQENVRYGIPLKNHKVWHVLKVKVEVLECHVYIFSQIELNMEEVMLCISIANEESIPLDEII